MILKFSLYTTISTLMFVMVSSLTLFEISMYGGFTITLHWLISTALSDSGDGLKKLPFMAILIAMNIYMTIIIAVLFSVGSIIVWIPYVLTSMLIPISIVRSFNLD